MDTDALAIVQQHCTPCHAPGGAAGHPFSDARALRAAPLADALATCEMPPQGHLLDPAQRARLVAWASCGTSGALAR